MAVKPAAPTLGGPIRLQRKRLEIPSRNSGCFNGENEASTPTAVLGRWRQGNKANG